MHPMKEDNPMSNEANERHIADDPSLWWKQAVVYQVYRVRSKTQPGRASETSQESHNKSHI